MKIPDIGLPIASNTGTQSNCPLDDSNDHDDDEDDDDDDDLYYQNQHTWHVYLSVGSRLCFFLLLLFFFFLGEFSSAINSLLPH